MDSCDRRIIHFDMDAFFASIEQRDFPEYAGKPIVVGGRPGQRGVVATCSYEARPFGIHSAMPSSRAARLCPQVIFIKPRFDVYREVSSQIRGIFLEFTSLVEMLSLDEAYLDVCASAADVPDACALAREVKQRVLQETSLTVSAGVSYNKFLAKIASDMDKPDGLYAVPPERGAAFAESLPIGKFHGIGKVTQARMRAMGVETGADLKRLPLKELTTAFGKVGRYYYHAARGVDERPVVADRVRKSIGSETTFQRDLVNTDDMMRELRVRAAEVARSLAARRFSGRTVTLKVKFADFTQVTRSHTLGHPLSGLREMLSLLPGLLGKTDAGRRPVRLLGVAVSNLCPSTALRKAAASRQAMLDLPVCGESA